MPRRCRHDTRRRLFPARQGLAPPGLSGTLAQAMVHENERSGAAWTLEWLTLPPLAAAASLRLALALTSDLTFLQTARA